MKYLIVIVLAISPFGAVAQQIQFLDLPSFFDREFEISGLTGNSDNLFLGAERCEKIFVISKKDMTHVQTIHLDVDALQDGIEIEGLCLYKDLLLITDEKKGKIFSYNLKTEKLKAIEIKGKDLSSFKGDYGMEGIAVDNKSNTLYLLRERNKKNQSEIHSFSISEKGSSLILDHVNETTVQHKNSNWKYSGLSVDSKNRRLLCLKSNNIKDKPKSSKKVIDFIPFQAFSGREYDSSKLISLSKEVYFFRNSYATNIEGIYSDDTSIYITSDNGAGNKDCSNKAIKTAMIKVSGF